LIVYFRIIIEQSKKVSSQIVNCLKNVFGLGYFSEKKKKNYCSAINISLFKSSVRMFNLPSLEQSRCLASFQSCDSSSFFFVWIIISWHVILFIRYWIFNRKSKAILIIDFVYCNVYIAMHRRS